MISETIDPLDFSFGSYERWKCRIKQSIFSGRTESSRGNSSGGILQGFSPAVIMQATRQTTKRTKTDVYWIKLSRCSRWEWSQEETRHIRMKQWGTQFRKSLAIPPSIRKGRGRSYQISHDHADVRSCSTSYNWTLQNCKKWKRQWIKNKCEL